MKIYHRKVKYSRTLFILEYLNVYIKVPLVDHASSILGSCMVAISRAFAKALKLLSAI